MAETAPDTQRFGDDGNDGGPGDEAGLLRARPLSMTDEEGDIERFRAYLRGLSPEALWDVRAHLDEEHYPRRTEAVEREIGRRNLFFVSPYTATEARLRSLFWTCAALAVLAVVLRGVGRLEVNLLPGEKLPWFLDLAAVGGPRAARMTLPLVRSAAASGLALTLLASLYAGFLLVRRRLRAEVLVLGIVVFVVGAALTAAAFR